MKKLLLLFCTAGLALSASAQKYMTRMGKVTFFSATPVENIEAINNEAAAVLDAATGELVYQVPIKSFRFEKQLMEEHFNENYMESSRFPKAVFKGRLEEPSRVNFKADGTYPVNAKGELTIHGVTHIITVPGSITVKNGQVTAASRFKVKTADYDIKIPAATAGKIAGSIEITVNSLLSVR